MAQRLERIVVHGFAVIRKWAPAAEIAALTLAQSVRPVHGPFPN